jgi:hypothetical protein
MLGRSLVLGSMGALAMTVVGLSWSGCASSSGGGGGGGPVSGPADKHCAGMPSQPTNQGDCHVTGPLDAGTGDGSTVSDYGPTMYGSEGDDDDCKYHVSWTSTAIAENQNVTFTVTADYKATGEPNPPACSGCAVAGLNTSNMEAEVYLNDTHPAPPTDQVVTAGAAGTYSIGPIQFDAPGKWTVRFHLFELCSDITADSPHGHAAFYVDVP